MTQFETAFRTGLDVVYSEFGTAATYYPQTGGTVAITVIESRDSELVPDGTITTAAEDVLTFSIRQSEITLPKRNDLMLVGNCKYTVKRAEPADSVGMEWTVYVRPA